VRDAAGALINYVAVKRDVTREVQLDAQLRQMQKMEAIGQLAGGVAHDFNNILTGLLLQVNLLETTPNLPAEVQEGLEEIRQASHSAADLTRQLLMFSRRQVMQPGHLDLNTVVTKLAKMLQRLLGADVRLQLQLHPAPLMICADPGMTEQVLMNLAVNARDAMPGGGRLMILTGETLVDEPLAREHPDARPGRYASVSVNDTGTGIPPEVFPRIFEPFFTTKEVGKGTGLGLATVFGIVKQHQGWIKVDNQPGRGVSFQIFLPVNCGPAPAAAPVVAAPPPATRGTKTILMVEDEPMIRSTVRKLLECHGYQVLVAANGIEALHLWLEHQAAVSLLLTDLVMPGGVSGRELARRLKKGAPQLKIVFMSGYNVDLAGQKLALDSEDKFVQKPFAPRQLLQVIQESLAV
jgi:nitrogen-specific signal transduction histidine kinase